MAKLPLPFAQDAVPNAAENSPSAADWRIIAKELNPLAFVAVPRAIADGDKAWA